MVGVEEEEGSQSCSDVHKVKDDDVDNDDDGVVPFKCV